MGSVAGMAAYPNGALYVTSKFAVHGFTQALREDLLGRPIRLTNVAPGSWRRTSRASASAGDEEVARSVYEGVALGGAMQPADVADCVLFALTRPPHVNVDEIVVKALAQSSGAAHPPRGVRLRSQYDREILRLAVPALGALAAEPLYILVDTAVVGHLGREQLAALGVSAVVLTTLFAIFNFLQYGTTAQVGRASGAGQERGGAAGSERRRSGSASRSASRSQSAVVALAPQIVRAMGADGDTADYAVTYLRIVSLGLPAVFVTIGAQGYLRGVADLRTPFAILVAGNALNVVLNITFVYGLDWGIEGSAMATVIGQTGMGAAFVVALLRSAGHDLRPRPALMRRLISVGRYIFVRTLALMAAFLLAGAIVTRFGDASIGGTPDRLPALALPRARARLDRDRGPGARRPRPRRRRHAAGIRRERADDLARGLRRRILRCSCCCCSRTCSRACSRATSSCSSGRARSGSCSR